MVKVINGRSMPRLYMNGQGKGKGTVTVQVKAKVKVI
jgi:hypothetical protein